MKSIYKHILRFSSAALPVFLVMACTQGVTPLDISFDDLFSEQVEGTDVLYDGVDVPVDGPCGAGETLCGTECVDLDSDVSNCGTCGNACAEGEVCSRGTCSSDCEPGLINCSGSCVDTSMDAENCGECGNACEAPRNAEPMCVAGECSFECFPGWSDINGDPSDGCEVECTFVSAEEVCNGIDDNCNGSIDEGFDCPMNRETACTTTCGSIGTGICGLDCRYPTAANCHAPAETCNGVDDDCDGAADNGFACARGETVECTTACGTTGTGICTSSCEIPTGSSCSAGAETCNGLDDNCNGSADETFPCVQGSSVTCTTTCGSSGTGTCGMDCSLPSASACTPPPETCNGIDDNCNGTCDDGYSCCRGDTQSQSCGNCGSQTRTCSSSCSWGTWGTCTGVGVCSPGSTQACGNCGTQVCSSTCAWGACTGEGVCTPGTTRTCTVGSCSGTETCSSSCAWGSCNLGSPPSNNTCTGAISVGSGGTFSGTTCGASNTYTATCGAGAGSPDVTYRLDIASPSDVVIDTSGTSWDTVLHLHSGSCTGTETACDDDGGSGAASRIATTLTAGTYYIIVDGFSTSSAGPYSLSVTVTPSRPANDDCSGAILITSGGTFSGDTTTATDDSGYCSGYGTRGVWYRFTLSQSEVVYLDTQDGQSWDSVISVNSGSCTGSNVLCIDDQYCSGLRSQGVGYLSAGTYYVLVSGFGSTAYGTFTLRFKHTPCPEALQLTSTSTSSSTTGLGSDQTSSCSASGPDRPYFFYQCPGSRTISFNTCTGTSYDSSLTIREMTGNSGGACGDIERACNDDSCGLQSSVSYYATGPGLFFIIVDGCFSSSYGSYTLTSTYY
jgi:hypothetical protein